MKNIDMRRALTKSFHTIAELEDYYYGPADAYLRKDEETDLDTTGARNIIYGQRAWEQIVTAANAFSALPKKPWDKSGYRALTAAGITTSAGISENADVPATYQPDWVEVGINPKILGAAFEMSFPMYALQGKDDNISWNDFVEYESREFINRIDRGLLTDSNTLASTNIESLDRVIGSYSEMAGSGYNEGDLDIYSKDRDSEGTWTDAYVSHGSTTDRTLSLALIDALLVGAMPYFDVAGSMSNKMWLTGYDTLERWQQLLQAQQRFIDTGLVQFSVNGVSTVPGVEAGFAVSKYRAAPIIPDSFVPTDTISRIMMIDLDHVWIGTLTPIQYLESPSPFAHSKMTYQAMYYMMGELVCNKFKSNAKLRDLK